MSAPPSSPGLERTRLRTRCRESRALPPLELLDIALNAVIEEVVHVDHLLHNLHHQRNPPPSGQTDRGGGCRRRMFESFVHGVEQNVLIQRPNASSDLADTHGRWHLSLRAQHVPGDALKESLAADVFEIGLQSHRL